MSITPSDGESDGAQKERFSWGFRLRATGHTRGIGGRAAADTLGM
jgi:hypothetical protein